MVLDKLIAEAWRVFDCDGARKSRVKDSMPILFFGNYDAYRESDVRIVTVGLNPSAREFPNDDRYKRFPIAENISRSNTESYVAALSAYFGPNRLDWFDSYEVVLGGALASYRARAISTALHTDICSPVATAEGWSAIDSGIRRDLMADGVPMWHDLIEALQPEVVIVSIRRDYAPCIKFDALTDCMTLQEFSHTKNGIRRQETYRIKARWHRIGDQPSLFAFAKAGRTPFQLIDDDLKHRAGEAILSRYLEGL